MSPTDRFSESCFKIYFFQACCIANRDGASRVWNRSYDRNCWELSITFSHLVFYCIGFQVVVFSCGGCNPMVECCTHRKRSNSSWRYPLFRVSSVSFISSHSHHIGWNFCWCGRKYCSGLSYIGVYYDKQNVNSHSLKKSTLSAS